MLEYKVVALKTWPLALTSPRVRSRFDTVWTRTLSTLEHETDCLQAENVLFQLAVRSQDIRQDGRLRANARTAEHPGVIISFDSRFGPLSYPCDNFTDWQSNVRAVALALEALRKIDRYGVTKRGEQYTGFAQLPPAGGSSAVLTSVEAATILVNTAYPLITPPAKFDETVDLLLTSWESCRVAYIDAAKLAHPDNGGNDEWFAQVGEAYAAMKRHHGTS